jgi:phosphatidate cytidylyltransferase
MELKLYLILLAYFLLGAFIIISVNKSKALEERKHNRLKYVTYFVIVNTLFLSILIDPVYFHYLSVVIICVGYLEIIRLMIRTNKIRTGVIALLFFTLGFYGFYKFSFLDRHVLFYVFFIVTVFDAFSQLTGQLIGKRKLLPFISPNKTLEGLIGGYLFSLLTSILLCKLLAISVVKSMILVTGISAFAFLGDVSASFIKRIFGVKDYSQIIPGHGGFLDRFDSLIFSGLFIYVIHSFCLI